MLTKFVLNIDNQDYELRSDDLKNWADVECSYKRSDYGGVVRSFMSKFEFVNHAYELLMALYDKNGVNSKATITLFVINDCWEYIPEFYCDLDFSSITYTDTVLMLNAIDASVEALIKANKNTKYEFVVGEDVPTNGLQYLFDRITMTETATYEITDGESQENGSLFGEYSTDNNGRIYMGMVGSETAVGGFVILNEDQEYGDGYLLKASKSVTLKLEYSIEASIEKGCARLELMKNDASIGVLHRGASASKPWRNKEWSSIDEVMNYINSDAYIRHDWATGEFDGYWIVVQGIVWVCVHDVTGSSMWENTGKTRAEFCSIPNSGTMNIPLRTGDILWVKFCSDTNREFSINSSSLKFSWTARGSAVAIDNIDPQELLERILAKMGIYADCSISQLDTRVQKTIILPAESIRGIPGAKIYASFDDFCKWMEAVFGYVYIIDEENWMIHFVQRRELFGYNRPPVVEIENIRDAEYSVDSSVLFSNVKIGYNKKDYEGVNGRDEFNFNTTYTTGYILDGKTLELISPFRADSYGIEFLVEKRGQDTTDNASDKDVFFVTGVDSGAYYKTNRNLPIDNSITGTLINGEFSPIECVWSNYQYISIMFPYMKLTFASTEGNADIGIRGIKISDDLYLEDCEMLTPGELSFTTDCLDVPKDINSLIRVKTKDFVYEGYLREVNIKYARPEAVEYKLMISNKYPCS